MLDINGQTNAQDVSVPDGFKRVRMTLGGSFIDSVGPFWISDQDGRIRMGLRIDERHCSGYNVCHGGFLASFADMLMPLVTYQAAELKTSPRIIPTLSLQLDYIKSVKKGDWLEGEAALLKITRTVVFVQGLVFAERELALRCSGVYKKVPGELPADFNGLYEADPDNRN